MPLPIYYSDLYVQPPSEMCATVVMDIWIGIFKRLHIGADTASCQVWSLCDLVVDILKILRCVTLPWTCDRIDSFDNPSVTKTVFVKTLRRRDDA